MRPRLMVVLAATRYLLLTLPVGLLALPGIPALLLCGLTVAVAGAGILLLPLAFGGLRRWAHAEQARAHRLLGRPAPPPYRPVAGGPGSRWRMFTDRTTWRAVFWLLLTAPAGTLAGLAGLVLAAGTPIAVLGIVAWWAFPPGSSFGLLGSLLPITGWGTALTVGVAQLALHAALAWLLLPPLARVSARLTAALLAPSAAERLTERVTELTDTRAGVVDAHGAELRRIERDLHDGTQAQLVNIAMRLSLAEDALDDPEAAARLLRQARSGTEEAMTTLRHVIRTMYPPILSDKGLAGALRAVVANCPIPTELDLPDVGELPTALEAAAYFVVTEALTNVTKHSGAHHAEVTLSRAAGRLTVLVRDDGSGGADEGLGTGIAGMRGRIAALDGTCTVRSPLGGPTEVTAELPCAS